MMYDKNNVFAKILRKEIPCDFLFENEHVVAFKDLEPKAPVHLLVIPKGAYIDINDFTLNASPKEINAFFMAIADVARINGLDHGGYRVVSNCGENSGQEVPHLHFHILGGGKIGAMFAKESEE